MAEFSINRGSASEWAPYFGIERRANGYVGALMLGALGATRGRRLEKGEQVHHRFVTGHNSRRAA